MQCSKQHQYAGDWLLVDDVKRVAYCFIPNVASSTLKTLMAFSASNGNITKVMVFNKRMHHAKVLKQIGLRSVRVDKPVGLHEYHKIIVLRNPFTRMLSAYVDKIKSHQRYNFMPRYADETNSYKRYNFMAHVKRVRAWKKYKNRSLEGREFNITFNNFTDFILIEHKNNHWNPVNNRCNLCNINYD